MKPATTEDILDLMDAYLPSAALSAALELGLFWLLAEQPLDGPSVAQKLGIPLRRCQYWLQILSKMDLLTQTEGAYRTSPLAQAVILGAYQQDTWAYLAKEARLRYPAVLDLALHIRTPGSVWQALGITPPDYFAQLKESPQEARRFTRMLYEIHLPYAEMIADNLDIRGANRLMDLGGGSGVVSLALLRRYPHLTALVADIPNVCAAGQEIARENSLDDRITYHPLDLMGSDLPGGFDLVLECDVGLQQVDLFRKVFSALNPGGRYIIIDQFSPSKDIPPSTRLEWAFLGSLKNPASAYPTVAEIQAMLAEAGFQPLPEKSLQPTDRLRWSDNWIILEAVRPG